MNDNGYKITIIGIDDETPFRHELVLAPALVPQYHLTGEIVCNVLKWRQEEEARLAGQMGDNEESGTYFQLNAWHAEERGPGYDIAYFIIWASDLAGAFIVGRAMLERL